MWIIDRLFGTKRNTSEPKRPTTSLAPASELSGGAQLKVGDRVKIVNIAKPFFAHRGDASLVLPPSFVFVLWQMEDVGDRYQLRGFKHGIGTLVSVPTPERRKQREYQVQVHCPSTFDEEGNIIGKEMTDLVLDLHEEWIIPASQRADWER
jgi:hypothetical protein